MTKINSRPATIVSAHLRPTQIRHVAKRRFHDAKRLLSGGPGHANGAIYLAGIAIECHLKADLLAAYPSLAEANRASLQGPSGKRWDLLFRWHDLAGLIETLPGTLEFLRVQSGTSGMRTVESLKQIAVRWSIMIRYQSKDVEADEAADFMSRVEDVHRCLVNRR